MHFNVHITIHFYRDYPTSRTENIIYKSTITYKVIKKGWQR